MSYDRDALLNDLKEVMRKHMALDMQGEARGKHIHKMHLDAVEWLVTSIRAAGFIPSPRILDTVRGAIRVGNHAKEQFDNMLKDRQAKFDKGEL